MCAYAIDNILVSLLSDMLFDEPVIMGIVADEEVSLRNLSKEIGRASCRERV